MGKNIIIQATALLQHPALDAFEDAKEAALDAVAYAAYLNVSCRERKLMYVLSRMHSEFNYVFIVEDECGCHHPDCNACGEYMARITAMHDIVRLGISVSETIPIQPITMGTVVSVEPLDNNSMLVKYT